VKSIVALVVFTVYVLVTFGLRMWLMRRRTGASGFKGISGRAGSVEWWGGVLFVVALALGIVGPALDLFGVLPTVDLPGAVSTLGAVLGLLGVAGTVAAQASMGVSWRIGVDDRERTSLVTRGPFRFVRNPIFSFVLLTAVGLALLVPNVVALAGVLALWVAVELQVRLVEEPYLVRIHGDAYLGYQRRVGRFVPFCGRLAE
jgi:protein-S-isoprenylcysteine O-methyltransferase Ste14